MEPLIIDPPIPYVGSLRGKFTPGKLISIKGDVPSIANRFDVNLQCGPQISPRDDIVLQIAVRILDGFVEINSLQSGIWDEELRGHTQPIKRADHFEMLITCDFNKYKITINDQLVCDFPQRLHYDCVTHLVIEGDVIVTEILFGSEVSGKPPSYSEVVSNSSNAPPYSRDMATVSSPTHNSATVTVTSDSSQVALELIPLAGAELNEPLSKPVEDSIFKKVVEELAMEIITFWLLECRVSSSYQQLMLKDKRSEPMGKVGIFVFFLVNIILGILLLTWVMFNA